MPVPRTSSEVAEFKAIVESSGFKIPGIIVNSVLLDGTDAVEQGKWIDSIGRKGGSTFFISRKPCTVVPRFTNEIKFNLGKASSNSIIGLVDNKLIWLINTT